MKQIKQFLLTHRRRATAFALVLAFMLCSITFLGKTFTDPQTYKTTIQSIDEKKITVLGVSAAIAGSATVLASVPDDATTPLADEMMDLSSYLFLVVCILVLEKSLLTVFGAASCYVLIPAACVLVLMFIVKKKQTFLNLAAKLTILALAVLVMVPCAMRLSDYIYEINQVSFEQRADSIVESSNATEEETDENLPWYKKLWNTVTGAVKDSVDAAVDFGKRVLNEFVDAVSAFVIAYCAIPILIVFLFIWLLKLLFGLNINIKLENFNLRQLKNRKKKVIQETSI